MKKIIVLIVTLFSVTVYADQDVRDDELIRELEMSTEYKITAPTAASKKTASKTSRIVKVKLTEAGLAKSLAEELDLKLISGKKKKVATFKVRKSHDLYSTIDQIMSHPHVIKVKHEHVMNKYTPR